jgi:hypothetical protein
VPRPFAATDRRRRAATSSVAVLLALSGAVLWGVGDFLGGFASRRLAVLAVLAISQAVGLAGVALWVQAADDSFPGLVQILPAAAAGVAGVIERR